MFFQRKKPFTKINITFCKTAARMSATEATWRIPSSPIVETKHEISLCKLLHRKSVSNVFLRKSVSNEIGSIKTVKNFRQAEKPTIKFQKLQREASPAQQTATARPGDHATTLPKQVRTPKCKHCLGNKWAGLGWAYRYR